MFDVVIRGGTVIDGTGATGFSSDLTINGEVNYKIIIDSQLIVKSSEIQSQ